MSAVVECDPPRPPVVGVPKVHETHSAYVCLLGDVAYKMKKPIRTDFLDCRTVDSRWTALDREFTLNSRFAPDVYLVLPSSPTLKAAQPNHC